MSKSSDTLQPDARSLYDNAPVGFLTTDAAGTVLSVNRTLLSWLGRTEAELLGRPWFDVILSRVGRVFLDTHGLPLLNVRREVRDLIMDLVHADGSRIPVLVNAMVQEADAATDRVLYRYAFIKAVDRLHYEQQLLAAKRDAEDASEQLRELAQDLERIVDERTAELTAANRDLDSFAYTVSHDLRAPLRIVNGYCDLLNRSADEPETARQQYIKQIQLAVQTMNAMIDGLLQLSMGARADLERQTVDLSALANQICVELNNSNPARSVDWSVQPNLTAQGDYRLLGVVLRNLLGNAWKYSARASAPVVRFTATEQEGERIFCVSDNGVGFDMQRSEGLFQPFKRMPSGKEFPGIGIGLSTVRRIIERHRGRVFARSTQGQGAEFYFTLPV
jgi:PAS domain S-box-containing protein